MYCGTILAVVTTPRDSHDLCLLGLAQLAQYDNNPNSDRSKEAITDASLSFQASIELENKDSERRATWTVEQWVCVV